MIFASNNKGKINEIKKILKGYEIYSLKEKNIDIEIIEDEDTFIGNATKKAKEIYSLVKEETIADDSGLCINCLDDFPGVFFVSAISLLFEYRSDDANGTRSEAIETEVGKPVVPDEFHAKPDREDPGNCRGYYTDDRSGKSDRAPEFDRGMKLADI